METYSSYAESSDQTSPAASRDVDFENQQQQQQQPWEDHGAYKVKFMCSYGGKIHPRPHDNHLSYVGGETKILAVDRFVRFADVMAKLTALCCDVVGDIVCFKYQLPGEDLDALISVTNDDDLQHMMHEYDRLNLNRSASPARLRLFLFPISGQSPALTPVHSFGSTDHQGRSDREQRFTDGLNLQSTTPPTSAHGNTDQIFDLDKGMPPQPSGLTSQIGDPQDIETTVVENEADEIQKRIQELRIAEEQQPALYRKPSDDNLAASSYLGDYHAPRMTEKVAPATGYQIPPEQQQPVYMIHHQTPTSMYMPRPVSAPVNQGQGYYVQRMPTEVYRDQPVYNIMPATQNIMPATQPVAVAVATQQTTVSSQQQFRQQTYTEGYRMVQSSNGGVTDAQTVAYDNAPGRQFYYANHGAVVAQPQHPLQTTAQHYQVMAAATATTLNQENAGNVVAVNIKELI